MAPLLPLVAVLGGALAASGCARRVVVMSWNVRNLFDTRVDGTEYAGVGAADAGDLRARCELIAGAVRDACPGGPDIVGLQEVENLEVLRSLRDGWLRGLGYRYYLAAGGEGGAVRVAFLSRHPIVAARTHAPAPEGSELPRSILEIECRVRGRTLHVLNNHWKSRIGGVAATEPSRIRSARIVARRLAELEARVEGAQVIVLGDLNENPPAREPRGPSALDGVLELSADRTAVAGGTGACLYEPWLERGSPHGSYAYGGVWERPDHVLLSAGLVDGHGLEYRAGSFRVVSPPYLLDRDSGMPRGAVARGPAVYPDHLPILVVLEVVDTDGG